MQDITENLIKNYTVYHKIFYVFMVLLTVLSRVMKFTDNTPVCVTFATVVFVFALLDSVFYHMGVFKNMKFLTTFRLIEILHTVFSYHLFRTRACCLSVCL